MSVLSVELWRLGCLPAVLWLIGCVSVVMWRVGWLSVALWRVDGLSVVLRQFGLIGTMCDSSRFVRRVIRCQITGKAISESSAHAKSSDDNLYKIYRSPFCSGSPDLRGGSSILSKRRHSEGVHFLGTAFYGALGRVFPGTGTFFSVGIGTPYLLHEGRIFF